MSPVDLYAVIENAVESIALQLASRNGQMTTRLTSQNHTVSADEVHLTGIIYNLLESDASERRLTHKESELLRLLCLYENKTLERNLALREIWGDESYFNARSMDVFIAKLRKYLKEDGQVEISSVHGIGFKLTVG